MFLKAKIAIAAVALPVIAMRNIFAAHGTADEVGAKWLRNIQAAQPEMTAGVQRVTVAPGVSAAAKAQKWINSLQDPAVQDKWKRNVSNVSLQQWQSAMTTYGINRVSQGAQEKLPKFVTAMNSLLPFIDNLASQVRNMPDNTYADREQRMLAQVRGMRNYKKPAGV